MPDDARGRRRTAMSRVEVFQDDEYWRVEHVDTDDDGICEVATFSGPHAEAQAREFALREYGLPIGDEVSVSRH